VREHLGASCHRLTAGPSLATVGVMPIPTDVREEALEAVRELCARRAPESVADELRIEVAQEGNAITITELRAPWQPSAREWTRTPIAQLRYRVGTGQWSLREPTATGWTTYRGGRGPTKTIWPQLEELDADPTGIFWG